MKLVRFRELLDKYLSEKGILLFPDGIYGGYAYCIDENGFYGPKEIPDHVVPVYFTEKSMKEFMQRLMDDGVSLVKSRTEDIIKYAEGIDLRYGECWDLDPEEFINMLREGCAPETPYLIPPDYQYDDFKELMGEGIPQNYEHTEWDKLSDEDITEWIHIFENINGSSLFRVANTCEEKIMIMLSHG